MRRRLLLAATGATGALLVVGAACGGDSSPGADDLSDEFIAAAQGAADGSVLTIDDFPAGWVGMPEGEDDDDSADLELGRECDVLLGNLGDFEGEVASADSDDFSGPDDEDVSSGAAVFASEATAQEAVEAINGAVDTCRTDFEEALLFFFQSNLEDDPDVDRDLLDKITVEVSFVDLAFAELGDATNAYRLDMSVVVEEETLEPAADIVLMRQGRMTAGLFYFALKRPPIEREEALAEIIVRRLQEADASLPN